MKRQPCSSKRKKQISETNRKTYKATPKYILEQRAKKISMKHTGKSTTGKVNWQKVKKIRQLWAEDNNRKYIQIQFSEISKYTINDIISHRTWKTLVVPMKAKTDF